MISSEEIDFVEKIVATFDEYYKNCFDKETLIIPSTNDLINDYFCGKIDPKSNASDYKTDDVKAVKEQMQKDIKILKDERNRLANTAGKMNDNEREEQLNKMNNDIVMKEIEFNASCQPWIRNKIIDKNLEKISIAALINAFRNAKDIGGGILILSPLNNKAFQKFIAAECKKYPGTHNFPSEFNKQFNEICDCIYLHECLGIYVFEVKATNYLKGNYGRGITQLTRLVTSNGSMSILQKLYMMITGCRVKDNIPNISGIICTPNAAKLNDTRDEKYNDNRFHHFDSNLLLSRDKFKEFWFNELDLHCKSSIRKSFDLSNYRKFIATMANCSVGRELFGINNSLMIAKKIAEQNIDPTMMKKREYISGEGSQTIFLNAKQLEILNDKSKLKIIFGPPGTGKTLLVILGVIDTIKEEKGKVIVYTRDHLIEYMKRIFELNGLDENKIKVRDFVVGFGEFNENNYIFVDECRADESDVQYLLNIAKQIRNGKLFVAISGQNTIDKLCSIEEQIMKLLKDEKDYRIFQLTEILRGTKSIIDFWIDRFNQILPIQLQMECGHSIIGEKVEYYGQYMKSDEIMEKMVERLRELLRNNEPKNIVVICGGYYEKYIIQSSLSDQQIAFGSTIEQDNNHSLIAVELRDNVSSREWPFVISVDLFPSRSQQLSIISSSRAIVHLTFIERNYKEIRRRIRDKCDEEMMKTILSSFDEYKQFRNKIDLADDKVFMYNDLFIDIISFNYFPSQIKQLYPIIFDDCNTFDQSFDIIVNKEQWMLLLFVHQWKYLQDSRHVNKSIGLIFEYKEWRKWIETYEIEEMRAECLINNAKNVIELINKFIQPQVKEMMEKVITDNRQLFEVFNNSDGKHQFDLMGRSIRQIIWINCIQLHTTQKFEINTNEIDNNIANLVQNLQLSVINRQQLTHSTLNNRRYRCSML